MIQANQKQVSEPDLLPMVLQHDSSKLVFAKPFFVVELAGLYTLIPIFRTNQSVNDLDSVQPVLNMIVVDDNFSSMPLVGADRWFVDGLVDGIQRASQVFLGVLFGIVQNLKFATQPRIVEFLDAIFDTTVPARRNFEFEMKFEIANFLGKEDITASFGAMDRSILDLPTFVDRITIGFDPLAQVLVVKHRLELRGLPWQIAAANEPE